MKLGNQLFVALVATLSLTTEACVPGFRQILFPFAAGCLTTNEAGDKLLLVQDLAGKWTFPAGSRQSFFQSGQEIGEQETLEEADVEVDGKEQACGLVSFSLFPFDFDIFAGYCCDLDEELADDAKLTTNSPDEIQQVAFLDKNTIEGLDLRFPEQRGLLLDVLDGKIC